MYKKGKEKKAFSSLRHLYLESRYIIEIKIQHTELNSYVLTADGILVGRGKMGGRQKAVLGLES